MTEVDEPAAAALPPRRWSTWGPNALPYLPVAAMAWLLWSMAHSGGLLHRDLTPDQPDIAETFLRVQAATHLHAFTGAYSRYGWQHPGPAYFYLLAPFQAFMGHRIADLAIGTAALHLLAITLTVVVVHRTWGRAAAAATSVALSVWLIRYGSAHLFQMWNPLLTSTWTILFLAAAAATISGLHRNRWKGPLVLSVVVGSVLVQTHVGTAPMVVLVLAVVLIRSARTVLGAPARATFCALVLGVGVVLWAPVAVDQVSGSGNVSALVHYFVGGRELPSVFDFPKGATQKHQPASKTVPRGAAVLSLRIDDLGGRAGPDLVPSAAVRGSPLDAVILMLLIGGNAWLAYAQRRRRRPIAVLARITLLATFTALGSLLLVRGPGFDLYQVHFLTGVGFWLWVTPVVYGALRVAEAARARDVRDSLQATRRRASWRFEASAFGVALVATAVLVPMAHQTIPLFEVDHRSAASLVLASQPNLRRVNLDASHGLGSDLLRTTMELTRAGVLVGTRPYWRQTLSPDQAIVYCNAPTVSLTPASSAPSRGEIGIFRTSDTDPGIRVTLSKTTC